MQLYPSRCAGAIIVLALTAIDTTSAQSAYEPYGFTTLAGSSGYGTADGTGSNARFNFGFQGGGVAVDTDGNLYVADSGNHTIRKVTPDGVATTLAGRAGIAGSENGTGSAARFYFPQGIAVDPAGSLYVADAGNSTIRKMTPDGVVTTIAGRAGIFGCADGTGTNALFSNPSGVALDSAGNLYVADSCNSLIRKVTPGGAVTTLAGLAEFNCVDCCAASGHVDGTGSEARFAGPTSLAVDGVNHLFVVDASGIRKVTVAGVVTTIEGVGFGFYSPAGLGVDSSGNLYVADSSRNSSIKKVTPEGVVTTLAGLPFNRGSADGIGSEARFDHPSGVGVDGAGNVYVADSFNNTIRKVTQAGVVTTLAGMAGSSGSADGTGNHARFNYPDGVAVDNTGNVYVADTSNSTVRKVTPAGVVTTLAGLAGMVGSTDGASSDARFNFPSGVAADSTGNVYVADSLNSTIRKVTSVGMVTTVAGIAQFMADGSPVTGSADGPVSIARFFFPGAVAVGSTGDLYVADTYNHTIRKVTPEGAVTTLAGLAGQRGSADGMGSTARFYLPGGVAVDSAGTVYVADTFNGTIRKVTPQGVVITLAGLAGILGSADGTGAVARFGASINSEFGGPAALAVDSAGNIYAADRVNDTIRKVTPMGQVTTLAGLTGILGSADGTGSDARFGGAPLGSLDFYRGPAGVAVDGAGNVYVADTGNNTIRKGFPALKLLHLEKSGGQFSLLLTGPSGQSVILEASSDLTSWQPVSTNTFGVDLKFSDPQSGASANRFYRARVP